MTRTRRATATPAITATTIIPTGRTRLKQLPEPAGISAATLRKATASGILGLYALLALGSGLDRLSADKPAVERLVPGPFRAIAERSLARSALAQRQSGAALAAATAAVSADPVDPQAAALLGIAQGLTGEAEKADSAFRVAARFGWRDLPTQLYWYQAALRARDLEVAADRADAILRVFPAFPGRDDMLEPLESEAGARRILARHLAKRPDWLKFYFSGDPGQSEAVLARRVRIGQELGPLLRGTGCADVLDFTRLLVSRGHRADAVRVWNANCPEKVSGQGLVDADYAMFAGNVPNPFGWIHEPSGDATVTVERKSASASDTAVLVLRNDGMATAPMLRQAVGLAPGKYRIRALLAPPLEGVDGRLMATVACGHSRRFNMPERGSLAGDGQLLTVEPCRNQVLVLWLRQGQGTAKLRGLRLAPVTTPGRAIQ